MLRTAAVHSLAVVEAEGGVLRHSDARPALAEWSSRLQLRLRRLQRLGTCQQALQVYVLLHQPCYVLQESSCCSWCILQHRFLWHQVILQGQHTVQHQQPVMAGWLVLYTAEDSSMCQT